MKQFIFGILLGSLLTGTLVGAGDYLHQGSGGGGDYLGRSETQAQFDYFRERALQLDVENIRREQVEQKYRNLGKSPC